MDEGEGREKRTRCQYFSRGSSAAGRVIITLAAESRRRPRCLSCGPYIYIYIIYIYIYIYEPTYGSKPRRGRFKFQKSFTRKQLNHGTTFWLNHGTGSHPSAQQGLYSALQHPKNFFSFPVSAKLYPQESVTSGLQPKFGFTFTLHSYR
jgi:hypothetical protein